MRIVLMRKLAKCLDGVDVSDREVGDVLDLPTAAARALVAERWAIPDRRAAQIHVASLERRRASEADPSAAPSAEIPFASRAPLMGRRAVPVDPTW